MPGWLQGWSPELLHFTSGVKTAETRGEKKTHSCNYIKRESAEQGLSVTTTMNFCQLGDFCLQ